MNNKTINYKIGPHSEARGFFEADEEFEGPEAILVPLIASYEAAADHASRMARFVLRNQDRRDEAVWAEASASNIEWILHLFAVKNPGNGLDEITPWRMKR